MIANRKVFRKEEIIGIIKPGDFTENELNST